MGLFSTIFGGSKQKSESKSESKNIAYPWLQQTYSPMAQQGIGATNLASSLLGVGGDPAAADAAYGQFKDSTGYETVFNDGMRAVENSAAGRQVLQSGAAAKALQARGQETAKSMFLPYLQMLLGLGQQGLGAGQLIGSAGGVSTSSSKSTGKSSPGIGALIGSIVSGAAGGLGG